MASQTQVFYRHKRCDNETAIHHGTTSPTDTTNSKEEYLITEMPPIRIPVPFASTISIIIHFANWMLLLTYLALRFHGALGSGCTWNWVIYFCEAIFILQDFQTALELSLSLCGPRHYFERQQLVLKGARAPKVHILITYVLECPLSL